MDFPTSLEVTECFSDSIPEDQKGKNGMKHAKPRSQQGSIAQLARRNVYVWRVRFSEPLLGKRRPHRALQKNPSVKVREPSVEFRSVGLDRCWWAQRMDVRDHVVDLAGAQPLPKWGHGAPSVSNDPPGFSQGSLRASRKIAGQVGSGRGVARLVRVTSSAVMVEKEAPIFDRGLAAAHQRGRKCECHAAHHAEGLRAHLSTVLAEATRRHPLHV